MSDLMRKELVIFIVAVLVIVAANDLLLLAILPARIVSSFPAPGGNFSQSRSSSTTGSNSSQMQFSTSQYASFAYEIYPNISSSPQAKVAMSDFNFTVANLSNGSTQVTMLFVDTNAKYSVVVPKGHKLYFLDRNLADDNTNRDNTLGDDGYILVSPAGDIASMSYPLPNA